MKLSKSFKIGMDKSCFTFAFGIIQIFFRYKRYEDNLSKTKETNRESEKEFVAEVNDITPGTEWERVTKLCDFSGKNANKNCTKDISRMKSILLQLKQSPAKNAS